ncbi:MAG: hypothetical protein ACREN7_08845 [Candidatus Dormibacteria bacterium]
MSMPETGPRGECTLYVPGHQVHWIQGLHSCSEPRHPIPGQIASIAGGIVVVELEGELRRYRHHQTSRLRRTVAALGPEVVVDEGWSILKVPNDADGVSTCFSIARAGQPWRRCRKDQLQHFDPRSLAERARTRGGFSVPGVLAIHDLATAPRDPAPEAPPRAAGGDPQ